MKTIAITVLALVSSSVGAASALAAESTCVLLTQGGDNVRFTSSDTRLDDEYGTVSRSGLAQGVRFYLRYGHGVARLEAWSKGKLIANTFYRPGMSETDSLRLAVFVGPTNTEIEAQCDGVNADVGY